MSTPQNLMHRRVRDGRGPHDRLLPRLPAQHHGRPYRRRPEGLAAPTTTLAQKAGTHRGAIRSCRVVALRRHLPALRPQLRRRRRRRDRRPGRRAGPAAIPGRPRHRRDLVQPLVPVADGRRRLRRRRLPGHRPGVRHAGRGRGADHRGARARHPDHHRHRPQPLLGPAPVVPGGARRRARIGGARAVLVPAGRGPGGDQPPNNWRSDLRRPGLDPDHRARTARRASGTCTCSPPSSPTSTGRNPEVRAEFEESCGSGSTAASTASGSTRRRCWPRTRRCPTSTRDDAGRRVAPFTDRDEVHDIYRSWREIADEYGATGC